MQANIKTSLTASITKHYIHLKTIPGASLHDGVVLGSESQGL